MEESKLQTYKFSYCGNCKKEPAFAKEALYVATEADRKDLETIDFFEEGEIDEFLMNAWIYVLHIDGEYAALGTMTPPWRADVEYENSKDIGMHVAEKYRGRGIGRSIVQQLVAICLENKQTPIAECLQENIASRATLESAGFVLQQEE